MQSLASVGGLPLVAPSNPYHTLPKHRSAQPSHASSPATQFRSSTAQLLASDPAAEVSLKQAICSFSSGLAGASILFHENFENFSSCSALTFPRPSDHKAAENGSSPYEPGGQGNLELAAITTRDAVFSSCALSKSASLAFWAATTTSGHAPSSMEHPTGQGGLSSSSGLASRLQRINAAGQSVPRIVISDIENSGGIIPEVGTTSLSSPSVPRTRGWAVGYT